MPSITLTFDIDDIPMLQDVKDGSPIKLRAEGKVDTKDGNSVVVDFSTFDMETENQADKELKNLNRQDIQESIKSGDSFF